MQQPTIPSFNFLWTCVRRINSALIALKIRTVGGTFLHLGVRAFSQGELVTLCHYFRLWMHSKGCMCGYSSTWHCL